MNKTAFPIQIAAERTGLSAHVIRIWEKRYGAVRPERTASNRRLYSQEEIERLCLLRELTEAGQSIGYIATLPTETLHSLVRATPENLTPAAQASAPADAETLLRQALDATRAMDASALESVLKRAEVSLGSQGVLQKVVAPLARSLGEHWRAGELTAAHEHFATASLKLFLAQAARPVATSSTAPLLVVATPSGQLHELGALLVSATAANLGWRILYLGPNLGAAELAGAALQSHARALALSIVYPDDDPQLADELIRLRTHLPTTPLIVGGRAARGYQGALDRISAHVATDLDALGRLLDEMRTPHAASHVG